ncbi:Glucan 1,3-beta-glucosidase [Penicillium chrysogenum]|uniref:Glucan 1,3-beta-glucosidase n=1 Tax=Penicillium chrysogenum TaxID=5076 RepID=A0A167YJQ8_PENCH|nr:Glucan 1,3-beta-glucosidase [Penicillium chrysogenum]
MRGTISALSWLMLVCQITAVWAGHHKHDHLHRHYGRHEIAATDAAIPKSTPAANMNHLGDTAAVQKVSEALEALSVINKLRIDNINFNNYILDDTAKGSERREFAPPLDYSKDAVAKLSVSVANTSRSGSPTKRRDKISTATKKSFAYTIPEDLAEAARVLAESSPPSPSTGEEAALSAQVRAKYGTKSNDTNRPPQRLQYANGLFEYVADNGIEYQIAEGPHQASLQKRATSGSNYWLANLEQRGNSPFAPSGYKVWRNVKDYGAKGDGVTDDTVAINKAISDGGRCGVNCGSSTIYPAVVFFPPGTYLISSPLIQYYNTQFLGDPMDYPTILAAASFVGLGVITSDVYVADSEEWYLNTNNFLRSVRNFKMDITHTDPNAYVCAIHWQVAQGTTLENIDFYMSQADGNTQQGIYMENGSGGFMGNLTFVGGNFGAYLGNQQFTTSELVFVNCKTAVQVHWDWAWTMQDVVIESCGTGIVVVGGAGGPTSDGQSVGSYILVDAIIANTPTGIRTSLHQENSTAVLLQNVGFFNVQKAIIADTRTEPLLAGGDEVMVDAWGFALYADDTGLHFAQQTQLPSISRKRSLTGSKSYAGETFNFFTRRRPQYYDLGGGQVFDVKAYGVKGDGVTDDTAALNSVLAFAANISSVVYIPYGVYTIKDTIHVPLGSRIIGQAWPQIMATGSRFEDMENPRVAVQVGKEGDVGILEIQNMMFTASGPTAGAVLMEWNVHESTQGSAGIWDSHFRVGGAIGSHLQAENCPKKASSLRKDCIAGSLLLRITKQASAYMENMWAWVADHDLDAISQDQIDIYVARGILVESQGPTWMYGTASEHSVFYQYQLSGAKDLVMGMIQTESPYFQPSPPMPEPFTPGRFPDDPEDVDCDTCTSSWAVRIVDSESISILGAGWFRAENDIIGRRNFTGFYLYEDQYDANLLNTLPSSCQSALTQVIDCPDDAQKFQVARWYGGFENDTLTGQVCSAECEVSIKSWFDHVTDNCASVDQTNFPLTLRGGRFWASWNQSCVKDPDTGKYCGDVLNKQTSFDESTDELCSFCRVDRYKKMQSTPYSYYSEVWQSQLQEINSECGLTVPTDIPDPLTPVIDPYEPTTDFCASDVTYTSIIGDTCDSISQTHRVASAALFMGNVNLRDCNDIPAGTKICIPFQCDNIYTLQTGDTCSSIEKAQNVGYKDGLTLKKYNSWINNQCTNLHMNSDVAYGHVICLGPQAGNSTGDAPDTDTTTPDYANGYAIPEITPPDDVPVANGTTLRCGKWHVVSNEELEVTCTAICVQESIPWSLFLEVNPSLNADSCNSKLLVGSAYCVGPTYGWNIHFDGEDDEL